MKLLSQIKNTTQKGIALLLLLSLASIFFVPKEYLDLVYEGISLGVIIWVLLFLGELINSIFHKKFGVDILALLAIISSLYIGETVAAAIVVLMLSGGEELEEYAKRKARRSLESLLSNTPKKAHLIKSENHVEEISIDEVKIGDSILVKQKEIFPVDGIIIFGESEVSESMVTGEPVPRSISKGSRVWSGSLNEGEIVHMRATHTYKTSSFSSLIKLIEQAEKQKAPLVQLADKYSIVFTSFVLTLAGVAFYINPTLGVAVLVVATPCPLLLAAPIAFIAGMNKATSKGILVKEGSVFEEITKLNFLVFDKTGTLTNGKPEIHHVVTYSSYSVQQIIEIAASLEQFSTHILSQAVVEYAKNKKIETFSFEKVREIFGKGVVGEKGSDIFIIGKRDFLEENNIQLTEQISSLDSKVKTDGEILVHLSKNESIIGSILFSDSLKENTRETLSEITTHLPNTHFVLATGDNKARAETLSKNFSFTEVRAECSPEDKLKLIESFEQKGNKVMMIGDGINDAPALAQASVGVAFSGVTGNTSTEIADVVLTNNDIGKIVPLIDISKKTINIAKESMLVGIGLSIIAMIFAIIGVLPPVKGAIVQECIDVLVILNALRARV